MKRAIASAAIASLTALIGGCPRANPLPAQTQSEPNQVMAEPNEPRTEPNLPQEINMPQEPNSIPEPNDVSAVLPELDPYNPESVRARIDYLKENGKPWSGEGYLNVMIFDDFANMRSAITYELITGEQAYRTYFAGTPPRISGPICVEEARLMKIKGNLELAVCKYSTCSP